jgi:hypothetical protein
VAIPLQDAPDRRLFDFSLLSTDSAMRGLLFGLAILTSGAISNQTTAQIPYPYEVVVGGKGIDVYAGPDKETYLTDRLPRGVRVEVFGEEPGGWLAIRPPHGSFSWMRAADVNISADDPQVAEVIHDDAICRVGSKINPRGNNISQVRMRRGELIEVLEEQELPTRQNGRLVSETWYRIAPPAGEFRYVRSRALQPPTASAQMTAHPLAGVLGVLPRLNPFGSPRLWQTPPSAAPQPTPTPAIAASGAAPLATPAVVDAPAASSPDTPANAAVGEIATQPASAPASPTVTISRESPTEQPIRFANESQDKPPEESPSLFSKSGTDSDGDWKAKPAKPSAARASTAAQPIENSVPPTTDNSETATGSGFTTNSTSAAQVENDNLDQLCIAIPAMASEEVARWQIDPLRLRLEAVRKTLRTPTEQVEADRLQQRLNEFAALQQKVLSGTSRAAGGAAPLAQTTDGPAPAADPARPANTATVQYDGTGWLVPVHSTKQIAPPYALLDAEGNVIQYVSPVPGFNLHRYVRKQVGVYGQRGYIPSLCKQHLTAERIIELDRHLR